MDANRIPFTEEDERRIASAATWGMIVALTSIAAGVLSLLVQSSLMLRFGSLDKALLVPLVQAGITVMINVWLLQASQAFRKVALTDEADQAYLLQGFRKLRGYFMVQVILILLAIVAAIYFAIP